MEKRDLRFEFGKNWSAFISVVNEDRIAAAKASLKKALGKADFHGLKFLDIGCGSGLFSLAAVQLGATVHSFDYDPQSVSATAELKRRYCPDAAGWMIERGSALDQDYLAALGQFDIVYSWGVLHHTGKMWDALSNVVPLVKKPDGKLFIAIYNDLGTQTQRWHAIKKLYVSSNRFVQWTLLLTLFAYLNVKAAAGRAISLQNPLPFERWRSYKVNRGMSAWRDFVDFVGGYPYETAKPEHIFNFYRQRGMTLEFLTTGGMGCNEYIFSFAESARSSAAA